MVHKDPSEFYNVCNELDAVPKLNSLYEWANWCTPVGLPSPFDAMFFLTTLTKLPSYASPDGKELASLELFYPLLCCKEQQHGKFSLGPAQIYEALRMAKIKNHQKLLEYAKWRESYGLNQWRPLIVTTQGRL